METFELIFHVEKNEKIIWKLVQVKLSHVKYILIILQVLISSSEQFNWHVYILLVFQNFTDFFSVLLLVTLAMENDFGKLPSNPPTYYLWHKHLVGCQNKTSIGSTQNEMWQIFHQKKAFDLLLVWHNK